MFFIRWFGLDTVLCVVVVQLFLMQLFSVFSWTVLIGLSSVTSFFYLVDRLVDLYLVKVSLNARHIVYHQRLFLIVSSCFFLGGGSFLFWLKTSVKFELFVLFLFFMGHICALHFSFYRFIKPFVVASIFTMVMILFYPLSFFSLVAGLIFSFTLLNLVIHEWFETNHKAYCFLAVSLSVIVLILAVQLNYMALFIWLLALMGHFGLMRFFSTSHYWFEFGECLYAFPFFLYYLFHFFR